MIDALQFFLDRQRFIVLGGHKCGTTSLHHYLAQHPEISMPHTKGKDILNNPRLAIETYQHLYEPTIDKKIQGEVSSAYLHSTRACKAIQKYFPDAKLIVILRNPTERALSHLGNQGVEKLRMLNDLEKLKNYAGGSIVYSGLYSSQIKMYYDHFDRQQIKIFLFDEMLKNNKDFFHSFFDFIDVDPNFLPDTSVVFRKGGDSVNRNLERTIFTNKLLRSSIKFITEPFTTPEQRRLLTIKFRNLLRRKEDASSQLKEQLTGFYRDDILRTQELFSVDLSHWL